MILINSNLLFTQFWYSSAMCCQMDGDRAYIALLVLILYFPLSGKWVLYKHKHKRNKNKKQTMVCIIHKIMTVFLDIYSLFYNMAIQIL